jgi:transcriptional regulator with XRE-family HTH domain
MGERVRRLREIRGKSIVDLALAVGLPPEELQRIEIGERKPSDREIHELAAVLHVNRSAILFGRSDPGTSIADGDVVGGPVAETGTQTNQLVPAAGPSIEHHGQAYVSLPIYDATVLADAGLLDNDGAKPEAWTLFGVDQLRTLTRAEPNQLAIVKVSGDSMAPTLQHGDLVLIDRSIRQIGRDGLYVITSGYEVQVKRITRDWKTKTLTISSDNPAYASSTPVEEA